jgi:hypothetical protein
MKRLFNLLVLAFFVGLSASATNNPSFKIDDKDLSSKFQDMDQLEHFVLQNDGVTLTSLMANKETKSLINYNYDFSSAMAHQNPAKKGWPPFSENKLYYIGCGALAVLIVVLYIATGGEGYHSR